MVGSAGRTVPSPRPYAGRRRLLFPWNALAIKVGSQSFGSHRRPEEFRMAVLLIGTLDTKGVEVQFLRDLLRRRKSKRSSSMPVSRGRPIFRPIFRVRRSSRRREPV